MICIPLSEAGKSSLHYRGATLCNSLSTTSKTQTTVTGFKESLLTSNCFLLQVTIFLFSI